MAGTKRGNDFQNDFPLAEKILKGASMTLILVGALLAGYAPRAGVELSGLLSAVQWICLFVGVALLAGAILLPVGRNMIAKRQQRRRE